MNQVQDIFLFRELTLGSHIDFRRIDSEIIFIQKSQAMAFAESIFKRSKSDRDMYRYELLTLPVGSSEGFYEKEIFGTSGRLLLREVFNEDGLSERVFSEFIPAPAECGSLCLMAGNIEAPFSCFVRDKIGVVVDKKLTDGGAEYTIYYLSDEGIWTHMHTPNPWIKKTIEAPVDVHEKIISLSASIFSDWQGGGGVNELMRQYLSGDIPWFYVPELISLVLSK